MVGRDGYYRCGESVHIKKDCNKAKNRIIEVKKVSLVFRMLVIKRIIGSIFSNLEKIQSDLLMSLSGMCFLYVIENFQISFLL